MRRSIAILTFASLLVAAGAWGGNSNPGVLPPGSSSHGHTYAEWSAKWWQWALSIPGNTHHPIEVDGGGGAATGDAGQVWFLAGTSALAKGAHLQRQVAIPTGHAIFFPIVNNLWVTAPEYGDPPFSQPGAEQFARDWIAMDPKDVSLLVEIDGRKLENLTDYRVQSPVFSIDVPEDSWFDFVFGFDVLQKKVYDDCVADGYWVMLAPLSKGPHTIHFRGALASGFVTEVTYDVTVE